MKRFLSKLDIKNIPAESFEILGEKAFPEGHIDILIKESAPIGISRKIIIEVKTGVANEQDLNQLRRYVDEIGEECVAAVLIAEKFQRTVIQKAQSKQVKLIKYNFNEVKNVSTLFTFDDLLRGFNLSEISV